MDVPEPPRPPTPPQWLRRSGIGLILLGLVALLLYGNAPRNIGEWWDAWFAVGWIAIPGGFLVSLAASIWAWRRNERATPWLAIGVFVVAALIGLYLMALGGLFSF